MDEDDFRSRLRVAVEHVRPAPDSWTRLTARTSRGRGPRLAPVLAGFLALTLVAGVGVFAQRIEEGGGDPPPLRGMDDAGPEASREPRQSSSSYVRRRTAFTSPAVSGNGRYVVYKVYDSPEWIHRFDQTSKKSRQLVEGRQPSISQDGRYVAFTSPRSDLVEGEREPCAQQDSGRCPNVYVYDAATGEVERISVSTSGAQADGPSGEPAISSDGRYVAFSSKATNLGSTIDDDRCRIDEKEFEPCSDIFVHDRLAGTTVAVSVESPAEYQDGAAREPTISGDGSRVAFTWLVTAAPHKTTPGCQVIHEDWRCPDVFVRDLAAGTTIHVSVNSSQQAGEGASGAGAISGDGRMVVFSSVAPNLDPSDGRTNPDVFLRDLERRTTARISVPSDGGPANGGSGRPVIAGDGSRVAFMSDATNLAPGDSNERRNVFVADVGTGTIRLVSRSADGTPANGDIWEMTMSRDGERVAYAAEASNLTADALPGIFIYRIDDDVTERIPGSSLQG